MLNLICENPYVILKMRLTVQNAYYFTSKFEVFSLFMSADFVK
jgi:hypothetical protein